MKRLLSFALSALLAVSSTVGLCTGAAAAEFDEIAEDEGAELFASSFLYSSNADGTITITGLASSSASDTSLVIPASYAGKKVSAIGDNAFSDNAKITSVSFANASNLTKIGTNAFAYCPALSSVVFSSSNKKLTTIGDNAFYNDTGLKTVTGATAANLSGLVFFGSSVFSLTPYLYNATGDFVTFGNVLLKYRGSDKSVVLPSGVKSVADAFFESKITDVDLSGVLYVGGNAFSNCKYLTSVGSLENCTAIGDMAFSGCSSLEGISYGEALGEVGFCSFAGCSSLKSFVCTGKSAVSFIGECAFWNCSALADFDFGNITYVNVGSFWNCFDGSSKEYYRVPDTVSLICEGGFGNIGYGTVIIPESVKAIAPALFGASSLTKIYTVNNSDVFKALKSGTYAKKTYAFGDMNADGKVIYSDITGLLHAVASGIGTTVNAGNIAGDYDGNGVISLADINSIMRSLG